MLFDGRYEMVDVVEHNLPSTKVPGAKEHARILGGLGGRARKGCNG